MKKLLEKEDPLLRLIAEPIPESQFADPELIKLVEELFAIMKEQGAVGVAAPQIGVSKQVIVFSTAYTKRRRPEVEIPDTALINPTVKILSEISEMGYEGCLNCGELMGDVPRAAEIEYSGYTLQGELITKKASGLEARIIQHEVDHLNGILFFDRVENQNTLTTYSELQKRYNKEVTSP